MKGENDEGGRPINGMMVWAEHLYPLPTGYTGCPRKMCTVRTPQNYFCCNFSEEEIVIFSKIWQNMYKLIGKCGLLFGFLRFSM